MKIKQSQSTTGKSTKWAKEVIKQRAIELATKNQDDNDKKVQLMRHERLLEAYDNKKLSASALYAYLLETKEKRVEDLNALEAVVTKDLWE